MKIPYHTGYLEFDGTPYNVIGVIEVHGAKAGIKDKKQCEDEVRRALQNPIGTSQLCDMAREAQRMLVITSDHTRPMPSELTLPLLLAEARMHNPGLEVRILIATGCHRPDTQEEMLAKFGKDLLQTEWFSNHDCHDLDQVIYKGTLPSGGELWLNNLVDWADLIVAEGFIEPHFFAGFSGGRKSVLPGIAAEKSVYANHCAEFISSGLARTGNLNGNPIHRDMLCAAEAAGLAFILNVVLDSEKNIKRAFAGHPEHAHRQGCAYVSVQSSAQAIPADIVITSNGGYPLDQNLYQAVKAMTAAEACLNPGGIIIIVAGCSDGVGGEGFYRWFADAESPHAVLKAIETRKQHETTADQWQAQILARILTKHKIILVSSMIDEITVENMHMSLAPDIESALARAIDIKGKHARLLVIPNGVDIIPTLIR